MWFKKKSIEAPEPEQEPDPVMPDKPLDVWNQKLAVYQDLAAKVTVDDKGKAVVPDDTRNAFADLAALPKDGDFKVFVGAQVALDKAMLLAEAGILHWWIIKTGRAFAGDADGLQKIHDRIDALHLQQPGAGAMMTWLSYPNSLVDGYSNNLQKSVLDKVFDYGADPNYEKGVWLEKAMRNLNAAGIKCFTSRGADATTVARVFQALQVEGNSQAKLVEEAVRGETLTGKVDDQTLLRATFSPDGATLKTYFNFATRRVQEVTVQAGLKDKDIAMAMTSAHFRDYDGGAIEAAQKALEKRGGKPTPFLRAGNLGLS